MQDLHPNKRLRQFFVTGGDGKKLTVQDIISVP
jgi:hypothetical protein